MASDAVRLLFIIMMIKACYYQQAFILSRASLQSHAIVSREDNDRADSHSRKACQHHAASCSIMQHHAASASCSIIRQHHHHASSSSCIIIIMHHAYATPNVALPCNHWLSLSPIAPPSKASASVAIVAGRGLALIPLHIKAKSSYEDNSHKLF